jgi:3-hydroxyacyl-CoA dehydrogenase
MWRELDGIVKDGAVLATNTSSLPVIDQATTRSRPAWPSATASTS